MDPCLGRDGDDIRLGRKLSHQIVRVRLLLGDGVRVLTRIMRKIATIAGAMGTKLRDRSGV